MPDERGSIDFIGTATVLLRFGGFTLLTDPNFLHRHQRAYLGYGLHATRLSEPAMQIRDLPPLDFVLLSHLHEDHFDRIAEAELRKELPILTTPHARQALARKGFVDVRGLRTWDSQRFHRGTLSLTVTSMPGRHAPRPLQALLPPVMGTMLDFEEGEKRLLRIYVSGDTLFYRGLNDIARRYPGIDLALLHLGGTRILGILVTMDARQGVEALRLIRPRTAIPIHYDDYDVFKSPLADFQREVRRAGLEDRVRYLARGERYEFVAPRPFAPEPTAPAPM